MPDARDGSDGARGSGFDLRDTLGPDKSKGLLCKFCGLSAYIANWARDGGGECGMCRNMLRGVLRGTGKEKNDKKAQIEIKCKDSAYQKWWRRL